MEGGPVQDELAVSRPFGETEEDLIIVDFDPGDVREIGGAQISDGGAKGRRFLRLFAGHAASMFLPGDRSLALHVRCKSACADQKGYADRKPQQQR